MSEPPDRPTSPSGAPPPEDSAPERPAWAPAPDVVEADAEVPSLRGTRRSVASEFGTESFGPPIPQATPVPGFPALPVEHGERDGWGERLSLAPSVRSTMSVFDREALAPIFFTVLFLSSLAGLLYVMQDFISDIVIAFILVIMFSGVFDWLVPRVRNSRWIASGITTFLIVCTIVVPLVLIGYTIALEAANAYDLASSYFGDGGIDIAEEAVEQIVGMGLPISREAILTRIAELSEAVQGIVVSLGGVILSDALSITIHLLIALVLTAYMFVDGPRLRTFVFRLSPLPDDEDALLVETFRKVSKGVVVGNGLGSLIQGVLGGIAMWSVGLPSPVLWGAVMAIFAFLPLIGIAAVVFPAGIVLLLEGKTAQGVGFLVFCTIQGFFVEHVVKTKMMGSAMRMHDVLVFLSILGGLSAFGIIGIVYGPLVAMMFMTLEDLYSRRYKPQLARRFAGRNSP